MRKEHEKHRYHVGCCFTSEHFLTQDLPGLDLAVPWVITLPPHHACFFWALLYGSQRREPKAPGSSRGT